MPVTSSLALSLFLTTERCDVVVSPDQELVLRRSDNPGDVFLLDPSIPRDPDGIAKIRVAEGKLYLGPGSTAKPILVNGVKVNAPAVLHPGDRIRVGYTVLVVQSISGTNDASAG